MMKKTMLGLIFFGLTIQFGLTTQCFAQVIDEEVLPEIEVHAINYKYLNSINNSEEPVPVKLLQRKVAEFDLKEAEFYRDDYEFYNVSFFIPEGQIVAAYDKNGNIIQTIEKFVNVTPPKPVMKSVTKRFPGWKLYKDMYIVNYNQDDGVTKKYYKLILENGKERIRIKTDKNGEFI